MSDTTKRTRRTLLMRLQAKHDERSWDEFINYYRPYIYGIVRSQGVQLSDREDLVQDICIKIWKALPSFEYDRERCRFRTWLAVIVRNAVRDHAKRKATRDRALEVSLDVSIPLGHDAEIAAIAEQEWKQHVTHLAWQTVSTRFSPPVLAAFDGQTKNRNTRELAAELGIAENTVHVYQSRVRRAMLKEIIRLDDELG